MKRTVALFCILFMLFTLCACGDKENRTVKNSNTKTVSEVLNGDSGSKPQESGSSASQVSSVAVKSSSDAKCDIDLTILNTTVAYSQVSNMWQAPKDYMGKTVKMRGTFKVITDNGRNYYSCNIGDATACCTAFLEFILKDDLKYPDEYPKSGETITVVGEFETYLENGHTFCQLKDASLC